jgi:UDP-N-acetylglucosamine 1-carboxyvinyltransferase
LLTPDPIVLHDIPFLGDILSICDILGSIGVEVTTYRSQNSIVISCLRLIMEGPYVHQVSSLRASFFCIGPILARFGAVKMPLPGGCQIGARPVVEHVKGLKAPGARVEIVAGYVKAEIPDGNSRLKGGRIRLEVPSVGATETLMMAAALAQGESVIDNAACEPEISDLAALLVAMGADIRGAGTKRIVINGVSKLHGTEFSVTPDRIEAGTYLIAGAITRSNLRVGPVISSHLEVLLKTLEIAGCTIAIDGDMVSIRAMELCAVNIATSPFPGFPTDLQAAIMALCCTSRGSSRIVENIFENRMQHVAERQRMGADIILDRNEALIHGIPQLHGSIVRGSDLRSTAALIIAGLGAEGQTNVRGLDLLDRGYVFMDEKLKAVGASIMRKALLLDPVNESILKSS